MQYEKQSFSNGQVLTAECLNRMEEGIKGACDAVPPTCDSTDCSKVLSYGKNGPEWVNMPSGGSGGASALIVVAADGEETSHSADDIYHHVRNGGSVTLSYNEKYYNLLSVTDGEYAWFGYIDDEGSAHIVGILGSEVEPYEQTYATATYVDRAIETVVGDMETVLDHIIVMQNSLIGGDGS